MSVQLDSVRRLSALTEPASADRRALAPCKSFSSLENIIS